MTQIAETPLPSAPSWATSVQLIDEDHPDAIRLEVPADMFGGRYITADSAKTLAAALTESAHLLDATEAV